MFQIISDWIEIDYVEDGQESNRPSFVFEGNRHFLDMFIKCHIPWCNMNVPEYIHAYEAGNYYKPLFIEISDNGEEVRLYREIRG